MTSDLCRENAIKQWRVSLKRKDLSDEERIIGVIEAYDRQRIALELRAVPDVPELVRYSHGTNPVNGNEQAIYCDKTGEYVLYSQAAEIIAVKDKEIERLRRKLRQEFELGLTTLERAEAAEAKLAQMEKNEAVAYGIKSSTAMRLVSVYLASDYDEEDLQAVRSDLLIPLYASPLAPEGGISEPSTK